MSRISTDQLAPSDKFCRASPSYKVCTFSVKEIQRASDILPTVSLHRLDCSSIPLLEYGGLFEKLKFYVIFAPELSGGELSKERCKFSVRSQIFTTHQTE